MPEVSHSRIRKNQSRPDILGKRADGFHELRTVFQTISLHDELRLRASRRPGIALTVEGNHRFYRTREKNLVYPRVDALRSELKIRGGVESTEENIPAGRGLGGGSSEPPRRCWAI